MNCSVQSNRLLVPFLKWAGGKRWFTAACGEHIPKCFNRYIEPFLGSGAVFFYLLPKRAIISDINPELIETYISIKEEWKKVQKVLTMHDNKHCKDYYYKIRNSIPHKRYERAARFIYLNRTCWNGLYRVNLNGVFNVPIGTKSSVILDSDNFESLSKVLSNVQILKSDFEAVINKSGDGDFLYIDPPYTVKHNFNGFLKYNEKIFSWDDQIRLRDALIRARKRGAQIVVCNADHESIRELYENFGTVIKQKRLSVIAASAADRGFCSELVIKSVSV